MARNGISRLVGTFAAIFGASLIAFVFLRVFPGDPARLVVGPFATPAQIKAFNEEAGLNDPILTQYWVYVSDFVRGDWGFSFGSGQNVSTLMSDRLPASLELGFYAFTFALISALVLALLTTYRRRRTLDGSVRGVSFVALGTPPFWLGLLLLLLFSQTWSVLPGPDGRLSPEVLVPDKVTGFYTVDAALAGEWSTAWDALLHLVLPAFALGFAAWAYMYRLLRANLLDVAREPFLIVVRSKGSSRWSAFRRHALPNAFLPTLTASGLILAQLIGGSVLVEKVFNWPGVGTLVVDSILRQDFAVVQTFILLSAVAYVSVNLAIDLLYGVIDPRVRAPSSV